MPIPIGKLTVQAGSTEPYFVPLEPGATYLWTVTGGEITVGQNSQQIMVLWGVNGTQGRVDVLTTSPNNPPNTEGITVVIDPDEGGDHGKGHNG
jgi:hypothetical protein